MENNLTGRACLDFYGLPGCGKSTVSHLVASSLQKAGYQVWEPSYLLAHSHSRPLRKIIKACYAVQQSVRHPLLTLGLIRLVQRNGYRGFGAMLTQVINLNIKLYSLSHVPRGTEIILFDEGLAQAAVSLSALCSKDSATNYQLLQFFAAQWSCILGIYCVASIETAIIRMHKRGTYDSRADREIDPLKKRAILLTFEKACEEIPNCSLRLFVEDRTPQDLADEVYQFVNHILS